MKTIAILLLLTTAAQGGLIVKDRGANPWPWGELFVDRTTKGDRQSFNLPPIGLPPLPQMFANPTAKGWPTIKVPTEKITVPKPKHWGWWI